MTTHLLKERTESPPPITPSPSREPKARGMLIGSALIVLSGLTAFVVYVAAWNTDTVPDPSAEVQLPEGVANWSFPEMFPEVYEAVPARPYVQPEMWLPSPRIANWTYPEMFTRVASAPAGPIQGWEFPELRPEVEQTPFVHSVGRPF